MRAQRDSMRPFIVFDQYNRKVGGDVGLIEDECLLLRGGSFMFALFEEGVVNGLILTHFLLKKGDSTKECLLLLLPLLLSALVGLE